MGRESAALLVHDPADRRRDTAIAADVVVADPRFRALLSEAEWAALPPPIRRRFSKRLADGNTVIYVGEIRESWMSRIGWLLAQVLRLIGGPLPTAADTAVPSVVTVTEDMATGGQIWTRLYARRRGFPQVIHSSKRFAGPTGLEEYVGFGIGVSLKLGVEAGALCFRSVGYFIQVGSRRFRLPAWASPGALCVTHEECGGGYFEFRLELTHSRFGPLIRQSGIFTEATP
jgi:hypothetical protein